MAARKAASTKTTIRARRLGETLRKELSSLVAFDLKDPKAANCVITRVEVSNDLRTAHVHVRLLESTGDESHRRSLLAGLRRASRMLRREVTERLGLRHAPLLRLVYDEGADHSTRIEELLLEIEADRRSR